MQTFILKKYLGTGESNNGSVVLQLVVLQGLGVNTLWVVNRTIPLSNTDTTGTSAGQVTAGMQTDITETLTKYSIQMTIKNFRKLYKTNSIGLHI